MRGEVEEESVRGQVKEERKEKRREKAPNGRIRDKTEMWRRKPRRPIMSRARAVTVLGLWKTHRGHTGDLELTEAEVLVALSECLAAGCSAGHGYTLHDYYEAYRVLSNFVKT